MNYVASTDAFTANGYAVSFYNGTLPAFDIIDGTFQLNAFIDDSGSLSLGSGNLSISGIVDTTPEQSFLLTGTLTAFGFYELNSALFEFLFNVTGGNMADLYGGVGGVGGVILHSTGFSGNFGSDFSNSGAGFSDTGTTAPVPEPATLALLLMGIPLIFVTRKWGLV